MISLLSLAKLASATAVVYAIAMSLLSFFLNESPLTPLSSVMFMMGGFATLSLILAILLSHGWRIAWRCFPQLDTIVFPNIEGRWDMFIDWSGKDKDGKNVSGRKHATAEITQSLLKISMEVNSDDSDSETIVAAPRKNPYSGRPDLVYGFTVTPHEDGSEDSSPYKGMAILSFGKSRPNELSGNYFTDKQGRGRFTLTRKP